MSSHVEDIVRQLHTLAREPAYRATIVKDQGSLPGLVLFLDNANKNVVTMAVETLELLSECQEIHMIMWKELGLVLSLNQMMEAVGTSDATRQRCRRILGNIKPGIQALSFDTPEPAPKPPASAKRPAVRRPMQQMNGEQLVKEKTEAYKAEGAFFKKNTNKYARTMTLQVDGLEDLHSRKLLEKQLLTVKGVVSFTFEMARGRVIVRARNGVLAEAICAAIADSNVLSASQVVRNENGEEVLLSFGQAGNMDLPESPQGIRYLDDEEYRHSPEQAEASNKLAVAGDAGGVAGCFNSAATFVSSTLYW